MTAVTRPGRSRARLLAVLAAGAVALTGTTSPAAATDGSRPAVPAPAGATAAAVAGTPVDGVLGPLLPTEPAPHHQRRRRDYGHTSAPDGVLRAGCHNHPYRYVVKPPTGEWILETFLDDRTGATVASGAFFSDADPRSDRQHFRFCRYSVHAGRFKIRAKLHWYTYDDTEHVVWLPPSYFRLRRR